MATITERLEVLITSSAKGAVSGIKDTERAASDLDKSVHGATGKLEKFGITGGAIGTALKVGLAGGAAAAAGAIAKFAIDGVENFAKITNEVDDLQRVMGGTAEDRSRMAAAFRASGLDDVAEKTFGQLAKRIGEGKDSLEKWGVAVDRNKDGTVNMSNTLLNVSDKFKEIVDPAQRAAFLTENFGKSGQQVGELLERSRSQIKGFFDEAERSGLVFSADQLEKGRQYRVAMEQLGEAWKGLSIQLAEGLVPLITQFSQGLTWFIQHGDDIATVFDVLTTPLKPVGDLFGFVADQIGLTGDAASTAGPDLGDLQTRFANLNLTTAVAEFHSLNTETAKLGENQGIPKANLALRNFAEIARQSPEAAQSIISGFKAAGKPTGEFETILRNVIRALYDQNTAAAATAAANGQLASDLKTPEQAFGEYLDAIKATTQAQEELQNLLLGAPGAAINYAKSVQSQADAQKKYNDAVAEFGAASAEATAAALDLDGANLDLAQSTLAVDDAQAKLVEKFGTATPQAIQQELDKLEEAKQKHPEAAASLQPLIDKLIELRDKAADVRQQTIDFETQAPLTHLAEVQTKLNDIAATAAGYGSRGLLDLFAPQPGGDVPDLGPGWQDFINGRASGGPVGPGTWMVGESGPEMLTLGASGRGWVTPNVASQSSGSSGTVINIAEVKTDHPGENPYEFAIQVGKGLRTAAWVAGR